jgi:hypothetical protein
LSIYTLLKLSFFSNLSQVEKKPFLDEDNLKEKPKKPVIKET